jgi:hypothetical protein
MSLRDDLEDSYEPEEEESQDRECDETCPHFDSLNQCCWLAGPWGLEFDCSEGDACRLGYKEDDGR